MVNHKLRAARKAKAWTIETAAEKVGVSWVTYSRWERGTQTPYLSSVRDLCKAFHKSPQDLGLEHLIEEAVEEESKHVALSSVSLHIDQNSSAQSAPIVRLSSEQMAVLLSLLGDTTIMKQFDPAKRETLRTLGELFAATGIALAGSHLADLEQWEHLERLARALKKPSHIDTKTVHGLKNTTENYWQVRLSVSIVSPDLLSATREHYRIVTRLLQSSFLPSTRSSLSAVASETALLAGMLLSTDMHNHNDAEAYYTKALREAQQANNDALYAAVLGRMGALSSAIGKPKEACSLLQEAQHALTQSDTFTLGAWLAAEEAEVQAVLAAQEHIQNTSPCFKALEKAETLAVQIGQEENTFGMYFDVSRIPAYRGSCNLKLRQPDEALEALEEALEPLEPSGALKRAVLLDLAEASIGATAIEQACEYVTQALEIIVQTQATSSLQRVSTLREQLAPWSKMQDVKDLDEQLRALHP
jgi:tetratricopeptide (TPR) repeat protein